MVHRQSSTPDTIAEDETLPANEPLSRNVGNGSQKLIGEKFAVNAEILYKWVLVFPSDMDAASGYQKF